MGGEAGSGRSGGRAKREQAQDVDSFDWASGVNLFCFKGILHVSHGGGWSGGGVDGEKPP